MTKIKEGFAGALSGKLGNFIAGVWKGIPFLRRAAEPNKNKARSVKQVANQEKFNYVNHLLVPFHAYINVGFKNLAEKKTEISAAFSENFHHAIIGIYPNLEVDYPTFKISVGDLPGLESPTMFLKTADTLMISWLVSRSKMASFNDQLMLAIYCPELKQSDGFIGKAERADLKCEFQFNPRFMGKVLHVYVGLTSQDRKKIATSIYIGKI